MSHFDFLKTEFPEIHRDAVESEKLVKTSPKASAILSRSALELSVRWLYANDTDLVKPWDSNLSALMHEPCFKEILRPGMFQEVNLIRKVGNQAAHGHRVGSIEALASLKNLFRFLGFVGLLYSHTKPTIPSFDEGQLPDGEAATETKKSLEKLEKKLREKQDTLKNEQAVRESQALEIESLRQKVEAQQNEIQRRKRKRDRGLDFDAAVPVLVSEKQTRKLYIDLALRECGWDQLRKGREIEYEVKGMPKTENPSGKGYADYVLWGEDGKPLAVIEAKRTLVDARKGRHQAELYANCLEKMHGQRPVIFYTNGFEMFIWDDCFYADRRVQGFYTRDELQLIVDRRRSRRDVRTYTANADIAGRDYQLEAIQRIAEAFVVTGKKGELRGRSRQALLVMATGSGKTRTAASLVEMLTRCNWAKRVLFLADRNALVTQAKDAFNELLPNLSAIDLTKEKEDNGTRLVFSTYPTIINKIDGVRNNDTRFYGVGHFDLIIVDEAHRSVYQKYRAIFEYFDSLLVGLTATPKTDIDRNTYGLFGIEDDNPTFAYELDTAVAQKYLVPPKAISVPLKFQQEGIKYNDLSEAEKSEYEEKFGDPSTPEVDEEISSSALNKWLFNDDTVDKVLDHVMTCGIKVESCDKLGKTIIFAKNHKHAEFIEKRFNKNYPEYGDKFLRVIDNYESKAQDLLESFKDAHEETDPQIAVSVDMMDTGVDAPRVVNLVFFKLVKSSTKFWQMIGRGTRLCPNLFGPGEDKTHFLIFDFCQNLEFFEEDPDGDEGHVSKGMTQRIFEAKLEVALGIRRKEDRSDDEAAYAESLVDELHHNVEGLNRDRFMVKAELRHVMEYKERQRWENLTMGDMHDINTHISHLMVPTPGDDELARRFDLLMLNYQLALLSGAHSTEIYINKIILIANALSKKENIPSVALQKETIRSVKTREFWHTITITRLDEVRRALRDLIKFIDREKQTPVYTHFKDDLDQAGIQEKEVLTGFDMLQSYKDRVASYVRKNQDHIVIHKLRTNRPVTQTDIDELEHMLFEGNLGSREEYAKEYGDKPLGQFIRSIVGLDVTSANEAFADFIQAGTLEANQMTFIRHIIEYLTKNGTIERAMLFEPPFTHIHDQGLLGVFDDAQATRVIRIVDEVNQNAVAVA
ncbi:DEAD/DEAH box helicase family protein [Desulfoluna butyratoxydans]|uniref:Helicase/uvrb n-terminal n=1 Tax=Desulfoluna butyratoxydans TaxID=231438 RepID=A0A4U8YZI9_9BACT|nr:DEAD/DEAH box helicase family protein [Desulfoluna butyratoxydans]VFQ47223.1 helicase/uvrb n-terminal [Desulfoluna butyratoxydans]